MKEKILQLRSQGLSYRKIQKILKCSRSLISYYINPNGKSNTIKRQRNKRFDKKIKYVKIAGGHCEKCGYNKCYGALHFHHKNPKDKKFEITGAIWNRCKVTEEEIIEEIKKCNLLCANCHSELHWLNNEH
jgi:hypothetical protein